MAQALYTYGSKTQAQIRDDILRTYKAGLVQIGIAQPNIGPKSDMYLRATGVANEISVIQGNQVILADQFMPDTAAGTYLDRWLTLVGLSRRGALPSTGQITVTCSVSGTTVATGAQLTDTNGLAYQVLVGGTFATNDDGQFQVQIIALSTGSATNHDNGDTLTWVTAPPYCQANATVGLPGGTDGLSGGADSEQGADEPPRARLFARLQDPPKGGNWSDVADSAQASNPIVQSAFVYPALLGPSTAFFAVSASQQSVGPFTNTSYSRQISNTIVTNVVVPYVLGDYPEHAFLCGASTQDQPVDIVVQLFLPSSPTASPPGPGGGWLDGTPWPSSINGSLPVTVLASPAPSSVVFSVNATTPPTAGVTHIAWLSPFTWEITNALVTAVAGVSGNYSIAVDTPMVGIAAGHFIFPQSQNQQAYVAAIIGAFGGLGPGEWTTNQSVLTRSNRHPIPTRTWPSSLDARFLKQVEDAGPEVEETAWIYRSATTPTVPSSIAVDFATGVLSSLPPSVFTPRNIAIVAS